MGEGLENAGQKRKRWIQQGKKYVRKKNFENGNYSKAAGNALEAGVDLIW